MHAARPAQRLPRLKGAFGIAVVIDRIEKSHRQVFHARRLCMVDVIALAELDDGGVANILVKAAAEQIVEHAVAQRGIGDRHFLNAQHLENRAHDCQAARQHRQTIAFHARQIQRFEVAGAQRLVLQPIQTAAGDAVGTLAIFDEDDAQRLGGSTGPVDLAPAFLVERGGNRFQLARSCVLRILERFFIELSAGKIAFRVGHATHVQAFQRFRLEAMPDDEFGGAAADIDHQPVVIGRRQALCNADINQPRLLATGDDFDRVAKRGFGLAHECIRILGHAQRIGTDHAYRILG